MQPHQNRCGRIGRADQDREMFDAAVARAKRDQTRILGIGERDARLGDAFEPGRRRVALEYCGRLDDGEISAACEQRRFALAGAQHEGCGQQRGQLCQSNRSESAAPGWERLGAETGRLRAERCSRVGEVADHRCGQFVRDRDRQGARQFFARRKTERDGPPARQNHPRRRLRNLSQPLQVFFGRQLGGDRKNANLVVADQHRFAAAQRGNGFAKARLCRRPGLEHSLLLADLHHTTRSGSRQQPYSTSPMRARGQQNGNIGGE